MTRGISTVVIDHEKQPHRIFKTMGNYLCPDEFEAKIITQIATAHGGTVVLPDGKNSKDTIGSNALRDDDPVRSISVRQRLIAALVRFSDEICEDRRQSSKIHASKWYRYLNTVEVFHAYANSISSVVG